MRSVPASVARALPASRRGFSLPELVISLTLLTVGLLALASTSAFLTYTHAGSSRAERAAIIAGMRLDALRAAGCSPTHGTETLGGLASSWSLTRAGQVAVTIVRISWLERGKPVSHRYESGFTC